MANRLTSFARDAGKFVGDILGFLFREGRWSADQMHLDLIEAVLKKIDPDLARLVESQLRYKYFFDWMSKGKINVFRFYNQGQLPLITESDFADKLYKVELFIENKKHVALVTFYKGRIFSVELKKPRRFFNGKIYLVGEVREGKSNETYTSVIDRAAHGKETEINPRKMQD